MTQPAPTGFPVTTAFALPGMAVEQDLGVAFGLVVRSMGAVKWISACWPAPRALRPGQLELDEMSRLVGGRWTAGAAVSVSCVTASGWDTIAP